MNKPKFIITANYNCRNLLVKPLILLLIKNLETEFIIADDGSTDKSISIIQEKFKGLNVKLIKKKTILVLQMREMRH